MDRGTLLSSLGHVGHHSNAYVLQTQNGTLWRVNWAGNGPHRVGRKAQGVLGGGRWQARCDVAGRRKPRRRSLQGDGADASVNLQVLIHVSDGAQRREHVGAAGSRLKWRAA